MAIGISNFPIVDNNLAERLLGGFKQGQGLRQNYFANQLSQIQNQNEQTKQKYLEPSLQEKLEKAIYENMIQKPIAQNADQFAAAKLAFEKAQAPHLWSQTDLNRANIPFINAKTKGQEIENEFSPQTLAAKIAAITQNPTPFQNAVGKEDAKILSGLEQDVLNSNKKLDTLNEVSDVVTSPLFQQMRESPLFGKQELSYYSRYGTDEQKQAVGKYQALIGEIIKDAAQDFKGQFRKGEQSLLESMKPSLSDTPETAKGKVEALMLMNQLLSDRSKETARLMREDGLSPIQAQEKAEKLIKADQIKQKIHERLNKKTMVRVKSPDGKTGKIPANNLDRALKAGYSRIE